MTSVTAGPGGGDPELGPGALRLAVEGGDAAEHPQRDRRDADLVALRDHRVAELVEQDRGEEAERAERRRAA